MTGEYELLKKVLSTIEVKEGLNQDNSSFHRSPDMIRLRIDGDKEVGCRQHIVMI